MKSLTNETIAKFKDHYKDTFLKCILGYPVDVLEQSSCMLLKALQTPKSNIYVFGNGGSHAIARHFEIAARQHFADNETGIRIRCCIDFHADQPHADRGDYNSIFANLLEEEKADENDLVVLISGSGDSDNLLEAAGYCRRKNIPSFSLAGFDGGKISQAGVTNLPLVAQIHDQQICEDVIQPLVHILIEYAYQNLVAQQFDFENLKKSYCEKLNESMDCVPASFLSALSLDVAEAFSNERAVFVLGPEGQGLSISAEHIAHNYNWDAVFELKNPPKRLIFSTPTACDFSGLANDRAMPGVAVYQQLDKARKGDILLLFVHDPNSKSVVGTIEMGLQREMTIHMISGGKPARLSGKIKIAVIGSNNISVTSDVVQALGHISARLLRARFKNGLLQDDYKQLIDEDMAQRRLLKTASGL